MTVVRHFAGNVLTYVGIVGAVGAFDHYRRFREQEREAERAIRRTSELESLLAKTRLEALRAQLQPHFLFNTLNMVSGLVARNDPVAANRALARLGELLRESLAHSADQEVPLAQELASVRRYLEIALLGMGDRLHVVETIAALAVSAMVPALILQPLIENAIEHGVGTRALGGTIEIVAGGAVVTISLPARFT